ncbi:UNVERIFIED_CONTAM: hypothetical protein PYX00_007959 [Menopon gallinae]|uniref:Ubiquinone biosynthesis protein n=1 Tax=Menopon gallinae TaxID=328185 RepID=A0AAW2HKW2_9NEOP
MTIFGMVSRARPASIIKGLWTPCSLRCAGNRRNFASEGESKDTGANTETDTKDANSAYEDNIKEKLLEASLPFVKTRGWTVSAIHDGAVSIGYPGVIHGIFPKPGVELIDYFNKKCNKELNERLTNSISTSESSPQPRQFIEHALQTRLKMIIPYIEKWPQAMAIMSQPPNIPTAFTTFSSLIDDICFLAGDKSVDINWYSRRAAVGVIYKATELCMIQDKTVDYIYTWKFLERRLDEAFTVDKILQANESLKKNFAELAVASFTTLGNIIGVTPRVR